MYSVLLKDNRCALIRPAHTTDVDRLQQMYADCSQMTLQRRFLQPHQPARDEIAQMCAIDRPNGAVWVAEVDNAIAGYAYFLRVNEDTAEPAIMLADAYHGLGLGKALLMTMVNFARREGITQFAAVLDAANNAVLRLVKRCGLAYNGYFSFGTIELTIDLLADDVNPPQTITVSTFENQHHRTLTKIR